MASTTRSGPAGGPGNSQIAALAIALAAAGIVVSEEHLRNLGTDPVQGFVSMEAAHAVRLEEKLGVTLYLRKSVDRISVDRIGLTPTQQAAIRKNILGIIASDQPKIELAGFE